VLGSTFKVRNRLPKWQRKVPIFAERFSVVDSPEEYYIVVAFVDLVEFLFLLNKRDMIDTEIWSRWKRFAETIRTIPKFKSVWDKTKNLRASEFRDFLDSFDNMSPKV
jgi:ribosome biogenesis GTPase A